MSSQPVPEVDAGPWLPQCVKPAHEGEEGFYGRAVREPPDTEAAQTTLGARDLPRVNARRDRAENRERMVEGAQVWWDEELPQPGAAEQAEAPAQKSSNPALAWLGATEEELDQAMEPASSSSQPPMLALENTPHQTPLPQELVSSQPLQNALLALPAPEDHPQEQQQQAANWGWQASWWGASSQPSDSWAQQEWHGQWWQQGSHQS